MPLLFTFSLFTPLTAFITTTGSPAHTVLTKASWDLTSVMSEIVATSSLADTLGRRLCKGNHNMFRLTKLSQIFSDSDGDYKR